MKKKPDLKKLLFVCTYNEMRSPTAETVFKSEGHPARSAGTAHSARQAINSELIHWADMIFVMEDNHRDFIKDMFAECPEDKEIIVLNIPDNYYYMEDKLVNLLKEKTKPYLD